MHVKNKKKNIIYAEYEIMINAFKVKKIKSHVLKNWVKISEKKQNKIDAVVF